MKPWGRASGRPASVRLPGRDDELAEGAGTKVRECGVCRVQRVDLVDHHTGGPSVWLRARSSRVARAGLAATGTTVKFSAGSWSGESRRVETNRPPSQTTGSSEAASPAQCHAAGAALVSMTESGLHCCAPVPPDQGPADPAAHRRRRCPRRGGDCNQRCCGERRAHLSRRVKPQP